jgi:SAM-dependent methyltransferase
MDWQGWLDRWDAQQTSYVPDREERFAVIADVVAAVGGERPRVLDLGCGPGSLALRVLDRLPGASVVALDADPVLLTLGREAASGRAGLSWVDADLRGASWVDALPAPGPYDAAVSTTALHWLPADRLLAFYGQVGGLLRPGGVFVDGDHFGYSATEPGLAALAKVLRAGWESPPEAEDWAGWWEALSHEPSLEGAFAERARRRHEHGASDESDLLSAHVEGLRTAGFSEVGTVWAKGTDRVLVGIR